MSRNLAVTVVAALVALGSATDSALATPPTLSITSPTQGSFTNNQKPPFSGSTSDSNILDQITLKLYAGASAEGTPVQMVTTSPTTAGTWTVEPSALEPKQYTAVAEQTETLEAGTSNAITFTVKTAAPAVSFAPVVSPTNNPMPTLEGKAGVAEGDEPSVTVAIYNGSSVGGSVAAEANVVPTSETWSYTPPHLADGTYTAQATQKDKAGNTGTSAPVTFTVDTTSPSVSIDPVTSPTNDATPKLEGKAGVEAGDEQNVTVTIYSGSSVGGSVAAEANVVPTSGSWEYTSPHLADGTYTAQATEKDQAGNTGTSAPVTFTVDTTPPAVSITPVVSPTNNPTPTLEGKTGIEVGDEENVTVTIYRGESTAGSVVAKEEAIVTGGTWKYTPPHLADDTYTAQATQKDKAGNTGKSTPVTFTIDTKLPAVGLATPLNGETVLNSRPTFSGAAGNEAGDEEGVTLLIYEGSSISGKLAQKATIKRSGESWSTGGSGPQLSNGVYTALVTQRDNAGNEGKSNPHTFTVNKHAPRVTLNKLPALTNDATPSFGGQADTAPEDIPSVTLNIYEGSSTSGNPFRSVSVSVSEEGTWSTAPVEHLADGTYTAQAKQSDEAGHTGVSATTTFTVDTTPPEVTVSFPAPGSSTTGVPQLVKGTAGTATGDLPSVTVQLFSGASIGGRAPLESIVVGVSKGEWNTTFGDLTPGVYTVRAEQSDEAGNVGSSAPITFTINPPPPEPSIDPVASPTNDATPMLEGKAGTAPRDEPSVIVTIYKGESTSGSVAVGKNVAVGKSGTWSYTSPHLADGAYTAQVTQRDKAGDTGKSTPVTFTIDTVPPEVSIDPVASPTNDHTPKLEGKAGTVAGDEPSVTVTIYDGTSTEGGVATEKSGVAVTGGTWSYTLPHLAGGTYTAQVTQKDKAGNLGTSAPSTFTVLEPPAPPPPVAQSGVAASRSTLQPPHASFTWFPAAPHTGETVSLASSSTDPDSPLTAYAWDFAGNGAFQAGGPVITTSFATPGQHVVRLRVTDAAGLANVVAETIEVTAPPPVLMQPFPVVRIAGSLTADGVRVQLLSVQAPAGAKIAVRCRGRGCPGKAASRVAAARKGTGTPLLEFRHFERSLHAGAVLEVRVSKAGEIGKYTRFTIRRGRPPRRLDECLDPSGVKPIACPSA
jgi:uncharacterized protein with FMN-binding domain